MEIKYGDIMESGAQLILLVAGDRFDDDGNLVINNGKLRQLKAKFPSLPSVLGQKLDGQSGYVLYIPEGWPGKDGKKRTGLIQDTSITGLDAVIGWSKNNGDPSIAIENSFRFNYLSGKKVDVDIPDNITFWSDIHLSLPDHNAVKIDENHWCYPILPPTEATVEKVLTEKFTKKWAKESLYLMYDSKEDDMWLGRLQQALTCSALVEFMGRGIDKELAKKYAWGCGKNLFNQLSPA